MPKSRTYKVEVRFVVTVRSHEIPDNSTDLVEALDRIQAAINKDDQDSLMDIMPDYSVRQQL